MTTEYMLEPGQSHEELARDLLEQAESPDQVHWSPRPDVYGGGVYVLADHAIAERVRAVRAARREEQAKQIEEAQAAADERDSHEDVASGLLTPSEAGFAANAGTDPGSAGAAEANATAVAEGQTPVQTAEAAADEEAADADTEGDEPEVEGKPLTPAQKRAAARKAKQEAETSQAADEEKSE
jgi:hypothetical protein